MNRVLLWSAWPTLLIIALIFSLKAGVTGANWIDVWHSLDMNPSGQADIIATYRLPRAVIGAVLGLHFALAGFVMQIVLKNPLADPTLFGISGGASLAVVGAMAVALTLYPPTDSITVSTNYLPLAWVPPIALGGGLLATMLVFLLSWDNGFSPARMVLNGVVIGAILNAIVMALVLSLSEARTEMAILWLTGSLYARGFEQLWPVLPWTLFGSVFVIFQIRNLSIMRFDIKSARSLGLNIRLTQPLLVLVAVALASSAVAVAGPIGFVGLLIPHLARLIGQRSLTYQVWICMFSGALLVVLGDTIGRILAPPREVPVGIVTSLIGAPVFAYVLNRRLRGKS